MRRLGSKRRILARNVLRLGRKMGRLGLRMAVLLRAGGAGEIKCCADDVG
jgi:hypothetical protein